MLGTSNILLLSNDELEIAVLREMLCEQVLLMPVNNLIDVAIYLKTGNCDAILCSWSFHRGFWGDAVDEIRALDPDLPVIILCRSGGESEWVQALEAGAFDLLVTPYRKAEVLGVVEQAGASCQARRRRFSPFHSQVHAN